MSKSDALVTTKVRFLEEWDVDIVDLDGNRWALASSVGAAIGAEKRSFRKLIRDMRDHGELKKLRHFEFLTVDSGFGDKESVVLSRFGIIRILMRSNAPRARQFRDWAEEVLFEVMTTGQYGQPDNSLVLVKILNQLNETTMIQGRMLNNVLHRLDAIESRVDTIYVPAPQDNSFWPTPTERLRALGMKPQFPKGFNRGGSFDIWFSLRHADKRGGLLSSRDRRGYGKRPDFVLQPCPENDEFLRESFKVWLIHEQPNQRHLKLAPKSTNH